MQKTTIFGRFPRRALQFQVIAASTRWRKSLTDDQRKTISTAMAQTLPIGVLA